MKGVRIVDLSEVTTEEKQRIKREISLLYCEIFSEKPWSENHQPEEVEKYIEEHFKKENAIFFSALNEAKVVGFIWGYEIKMTDLGRSSRFSPKLATFFPKNGKVFYLQEIGVKREYRCQGIGKSLMEKILSKMKEMGAKVVILSTNFNAKPAVFLFSKFGFENTGIIRPPQSLFRTYWILDFEKKSS